jgi:hypothetical protein
VVLPLDTLITRHVAPVMRAAGFKRKGRRFFRANEEGDEAVVEVSTSGKMVYGDGYRYFWVRPWIMPEPHADLWRFGEHTWGPDGHEGLNMRPLPPPMSFWKGAGDPRTDPQWRFEEQEIVDRDACGQAVADALRDVIPQLVRLLDRDTIVEEARQATDISSGRRPDNILVCTRQSGLDLLPLLADQGSTEAVSSMIHTSDLAALIEKDSSYARDLLAWVRVRPALRGAPDLDEQVTRGHAV